jgi:nucleoside-diphosphate-sugar epimerase
VSSGTTHEEQIKTVLVTGGGGYVGASLVPILLDSGYSVKVLDLFMFGVDVFGKHQGNLNLELFEGDLRDPNLVERSVADCDAVIHLACISNDPSFELDPELGKSINFDAFEPLVSISRDAGVKRFIYASSSSVYGVSDDPQVTESTELIPLTDYSKFKAECEPILLKFQTEDFSTVIVRPATVCGYSPRQRLDLVVNILTNHAVNSGKITVFGGDQMRPNIHIQDICSLYNHLLEAPISRIRGEIFNAGFENLTVNELAKLVQKVVLEEMPSRELVPIVVTPTDDNRSYRITSTKLTDALDWEPSFTIEDAVRDLVLAFRDNLIPDSMTNDSYSNIKTLQALNLS